MKKAKKKTKKKVLRRKGPKRTSVSRLVQRLPEGLRAMPKGARPKGIELFSIWRTREGHVTRILAFPADPLQVSHILRNIYHAFSQSYAVILDREPEEIAAGIISHFGDLVAQDYPDEMEEAIAEAEREEGQQVH